MDSSVVQSHPSVSHFKEPYRDFAKALRTWLIAYGVGVPVLVASQPSLASAVTHSGFGQTVGLFFLGGVAIQIAEALLYKTIMWYLYAGEIDISTRSRKRYKFADWVSMQYWLEFCLDASTLTMFVIGTSLVLHETFR